MRLLRRVRRKITLNPIYRYAFAGGLLLIAIVVFRISVFREPSRSRASQHRQVYMFDVETKELVVAERQGDEMDNPNKAVRAYVFGCGGCSETFIGFLELKYRGASAPGGTIEHYHLVRRADRGPWVDAASVEGGAVMETLMSKCADGERMVECFP